MRLHEYLRNQNGNGISAAQYRALKKRFPIVILNKDGEPDFRDKPKTRDQALNWLRNKWLCENYERQHELNDLPRTLLLVKKGMENLSIEDFLMQKFNINQSEI